MIYLVMNRNRKQYLPYNSAYKVFTDPEKAIEYAASIGFCFMLGKPELKTPGVMSMFASGDVYVEILPLEVL